MKKTKYIFITGGVCSSLGKGISASTIGALLEAHGYAISMIKIDPYINVDAGTMNPMEHGEVYVTEDGMEADLDLGNYERFTQCKITKKNIITTGQIYGTVIQKERAGDYLGQCVQVIPHVTDEVKRRVFAAVASDTDIAIVELGGTVGDIESSFFLEAVKQFTTDIGLNNALFIHLTLILKVPGSDELKTKPTQHGVQRLRQIGIQPDILLCRLQSPMSAAIKKKIAFFTHIPEKAVIPSLNYKNSVYELPLTLHKQGLTKIILDKLYTTNIPKPNIAK
jgi:CTP synthase